MSIIYDKLEMARQELLDLGLRNPLLNYRTLKSRGLDIVDERPEEIYRLLVSEGRTMSFLPTAEEEALDETDQQPGFEFALPQPEELTEAERMARYTDTQLQTPYPPAKLQSRLLKTYYAARTYIEERGVNVLYLGLGMLEWYESPSSETKRRAPLILIPVEVDRTSVQAHFRIRHTGEEVEENLSLRAKLHGDLGIALPPVADAADLKVGSYFQQIARAVAGKKRWSVDENAIVLGFFLFAKLMMYNDLDLTQWPGSQSPKNHPALRSLLDEGFVQSAERISDDDQLDEHLRPQSTYHVVDADASQIAAMLDVKAGRHLVIQGPPGTGKSQTIANIIAEALGAGKTVLFVSEKMAALEVVKRRLDAVHLGDACLELHSHKTNKKDLLGELERTLQLGKPRVDALERELSELRTLQTRLNQYCSVVNEPIWKSSITPYSAYGNILQIQRRFGGIQPRILFDPDWSQWTDAQFTKRRTLVTQLQSQLERIGVPVEHPFWGSKRRAVLPADKIQLTEALSNALAALDASLEAASALASLLGFSTPQTPRDIEELSNAAQRVAEAPDVAKVVLEAAPWRTHQRELEELMETGVLHQQLYQKYEDQLIAQAWDRDVIPLRQSLIAHGTKRWRSLIPSFRRAQNELRGLCRNELPKEHRQQIAIVDAIMDVQATASVIDLHQSFGREILGASWHGTRSNWQELKPIVSWVMQLYVDIAANLVPEQVLHSLSAHVDSARVDVLRAEVVTQIKRFKKNFARSIELLEVSNTTSFSSGTKEMDQPLTTAQELLNRWLSQIDRLQEMVAFTHTAEAMQELDLARLLDLAIEWPHASTHLVDLFAYNWYSALLTQAMTQHPILAQFDGEVHAGVVAKFRELDTLSLRHNRTRLALSHWQKLPTQTNMGQLGILSREFQKKRRHLHIRQLMEQAGHAIQTIKPVFMMSPMSIATYLPPGSVTFDLVIFDEASQVKPVDAFGAIVRGRQTVVVGDSKQLPPTRFFDAMMDTEDEQEQEWAVGDMESILGLFVAQNAPQRMLRWHYRSRHESLIAVSNYEFYNNRLVTFPSPDLERTDVGLVYRQVANGRYDRGGSRANPGEAEVVARAVMHHARRRPRWTLGVATFSTAQKQAILDQLEILRREDPTLEEFFNDDGVEPFFVKNLENVQGDERDVIMISVGYGRDQDGKISMNFGPLNQEGGERRLNVLITRARRRCEVFTNLSHEDIDLNRTQARGVSALKRFLCYAQTGDIDIAAPTGGEAESPFEQAVADSLRDAGYRVAHQVGAAGFRIDLAVIDENHPGRYLLGIECDGATYHSARTARDRDRIRQSVLEGLGWRIHRIWSTDWFHNPRREMEKVVEAIEQAKIMAPPPRPSEPEEIAVLPRERVTCSPQEAPVSVPYEMVQLSFHGVAADILEESPKILGRMVRTVVEKEGPIHFDQVAQRILVQYNVSRLGNRIREAMEVAVDGAVRVGWVERHGDFLLLPGQSDFPVRDRSHLDNTMRRFDLIAPQEIATAVEAVIAESLGITAEALYLPVAQLFGFARTSDPMRQSIDAVVGDMLAAGKVRRQGDHLVMRNGQA